MNFKVYIPARYSAARLPGKPLRDIAGEPLIQRVYRAAAASEAVSTVIVTDDVRIANCAHAFGAQVAMTGSHASGTDRIAAAVIELGEPNDAIIVNLQGDEPLMPPALLNQVARLLETDQDAQMATLFTPIHSFEQLQDPNIVKVVSNAANRAVYFSRAPIPWDRERFVHPQRDSVLSQDGWYRHIGIYAYRVKFLKSFCELTPGPLERIEMLEQLRALWHGVPIALAQACQPPGLGVDTEADLEHVRAVFVQQNQSADLVDAGKVSDGSECLPPPPQKPAPYECCGRGCERCVFVYYAEAMERWEQQVAAIQGKRESA